MRILIGWDDPAEAELLQLYLNGDNTVVLRLEEEPLLAAANVVAAFSTDPQIMNRAAFEAVGLGRPLVLSELPALRARFGEAAVFSPNQPQEMAEALRRALRDQGELAGRSTALAVGLREQRRRALDALRLRLEPVTPMETPFSGLIE